jgi:hypothetical protein
MKRVAFYALLLALAVSAGVRGTSARPAQSGSDLLQLLPDGKGVVIVDVQKVTSSSLWSALAAQNPIKKELDKAQDELSRLGVNLSDIQTAAVVFSHSGSNNVTVAVNGSFNQSQLLAALREKPDVKLTSEKYKGFEVFNIGNANRPAGDGAFVFYDARTVVAGSSATVRSSIDVKTGARPSVAQNTKLSSALAATPAGAVSFALETPPSMANAGNSAPIPLPDFSAIKLIFGTVDVTDVLDINATLRTEDAAKASDMASRLKGLLDMARGYLGAMSNDPKMATISKALATINIAGVEGDVKITGTLPQEIFTQLIR